MKNQPKWSSVEEADVIGREEGRRVRDRQRETQKDRDTERDRHRDREGNDMESKKTKEILLFETLSIGLGDILLRDTVQLRHRRTEPHGLASLWSLKLINSETAEFSEQGCVCQVREMRSRLQGTEFCLRRVGTLWRFNIYHNGLVQYLNFEKNVDHKGSSFTERSIREVVDTALSSMRQLLHRADLIASTVRFSFVITPQYSCNNAG